MNQQATNQPDSEIIREAASLFAADEWDQAVDLLLDHLSAKRQSAAQRTWFLLLDIYQARADRPSFERLAAAYAARFGISPPSWHSLGQSGSAQVHNIMVLDGSPQEISSAKVRDFVAAGRTAGFVRLDISRAVWSFQPLGFCSQADPLLDLLSRLTRHRLRVVLMGEDALFRDLRQIVARAQWPEVPLRSAWMLLLSLLQWRGLEEEFNRSALAFADRFGMSSPGYESSAVLAALPDDSNPSQPASIPVIDQVLMGTLLKRMEKDYRSSGAAVIDFSDVTRVTWPAAVDLATNLATAGYDPSRIRLRNPSEMILVLLELTGVTSLAVIERLPR